MKRKIIILISAYIMGFSANSNAQFYEEGDIIIDTYIGGPNLITSLTRVVVENDPSLIDLRVKGIPLIGTRVGYMFSDNISFGVDLNYTSTILNYTDNTKNYYYYLSVPRLRAMLRFEFHFGNYENLDLYLPVAGGYSYWNVILDTNDPNYNFNLNDFYRFINLPIALRTGFGMRYFFTDNIGANLELGLGGGPLFEGGLSLKF